MHNLPLRHEAPGPRSRESGQDHVTRSLDGAFSNQAPPGSRRYVGLCPATWKGSAKSKSCWRPRSSGIARWLVGQHDLSQDFTVDVSGLGFAGRLFAEGGAPAGGIEPSPLCFLAWCSWEGLHSNLAAISPSLAERYATQDGRFDRNDFLRAAGQLESGKRLEWHLDIPLVVLEHKGLKRPPHTDEDRYAVDLHRLQMDLASRSKYGKLIETNSGHLMPVQVPEIVVESIRDVIGQATR